MAYIADHSQSDPVQLELLDLPPIPTFDMDELEIYWRDEANFGFRTIGDGPCEFPDGTRWAFCTNWARYVRRAYGEAARLYGFSDEDNPTSLIARRCDGHDFAVVGKRYIVDGWLPNVIGFSNRAVHDLWSGRDIVEIVRLYGEPDLWMTEEMRSFALECDVDGESADERRRALRGVADAPPVKIRSR